MNMRTRHPILRATRAIIASAFAAIICVWLVSGVSGQFPLSAQNLEAYIPLGLPADTWDYYIPKSNPLSAAKVELGRRLFFDKRLSADGTVACATCHDPKLAFTDGKAVAEGIAGRHGTRNSPTILNAIFNAGQFWDGRTDTLEDQARLPLINPLEMGDQSHEAVIARLREMPEYRERFQRVFGSPATIDHLAKAIAAYERTLVSGDSPFDRFIAGDREAIGEAARRGFALFRGKARCSRCHTFSEQLPLFTDFDYRNTGVAANHPAFEQLARRAWELAERAGAEREIDALGKREGGDELGRILVTYQALDLGAFKTPSLRNVALTAPYFHDGSVKTLADVVRFYNAGGKANLNREWDLNALGLTEEEQRDLVAFLESLTGKIPLAEP
jgi:cytochrome c peroxidase